MRVDEVGGPGELLTFDILGGKGDLITVGLHGSDVSKFLAETADSLGGDRTDEVEVISFVNIGHEIDPIVEESDFGSDIELVLLLVGQVVVSDIVQIKSGLFVAGERTPRIVRFDDRSGEPSFKENAFMEQDHNVPRFINGVLGKNITEYYSDGTLWKRLNGTDGYSVLEDIYVGDYFQMSRAISAPNQDSQYAETGTAWVTIAGIDTLMGNGSTFPEGDNDCLNPASGKHHLVLIPGKGADPTEKNHFGRKRMNSSNTTSGGYWGSEMASSTLGSVVSSGSTASGATINQQLYAEFGSHLKTCNELVSTAMTATYENRYHVEKGASSSWAWNNVQACLMTEVEVYGSVVWSSSGYDTGTGKTRLPPFAFSTMAINNRKSYYWLRDVASSSFFAHVGSYGYANCYSASITDRYVRPRFVIGA